MKLKRTDLQNLRSPKIVDTYLFPPMFQYLRNVINITIYYNCTMTTTIPFPTRQFLALCDQNYDFCYLGDKNYVLEKYWNCKKHIHVPVAADFAIHINYFDSLPRNVLEIGLGEGFEVEYSVNEKYPDGGSIASSTHCQNIVYISLRGNGHVAIFNIVENHKQM